MTKQYSDIAELTFFVGALATSPNKAQVFIEQFEGISGRIPLSLGNNDHIDALIKKIRQTGMFRGENPDLSGFACSLIHDEDERLQTAGQLLARFLL